METIKLHSAVYERLKANGAFDVISDEHHRKRYDNGSKGQACRG